MTSDGSEPERVWRWCLRKMLLAIILGLAVLALATTIGLSINLGRLSLPGGLAPRQGVLRGPQTRQRAVDQQASHLAYEHGQALAEQGDVAQGVLWPVRGLKSASLAYDVNLGLAFRLSLSGWLPRIHPLRGRFEHLGPIQAVAFSPDGRVAITGVSIDGPPHSRVPLKSAERSPRRRLSGSAASDSR